MKDLALALLGAILIAVFAVALTNDLDRVHGPSLDGGDTAWNGVGRPWTLEVLKLDLRGTAWGMR